MKKKILVSIGLLMAISSVAWAKSTTLAEFKLYNNSASAKNPITIEGNLTYIFPATQPNDPSCIQSSPTPFSQSVNKQGTKINFLTATSFNANKCLTENVLMAASLNITHVDGKPKTCSNSIQVTLGEQVLGAIDVRVDRDGSITCGNRSY